MSVLPGAKSRADGDTVPELTDTEPISVVALMIMVETFVSKASGLVAGGGVGATTSVPTWAEAGSPGNEQLRTAKRDRTNQPPTGTLETMIVS